MAPLPAHRYTVRMAINLWDYEAGASFDGDYKAELEVLQERIAGSRLEFFEGGHGFLREDPKALDRVIAFLHGELDE